MSIIQLKEANCKNCYKCIRNCDVKSISFQNDQAQIIDDDCVLCGKCTLICPQNAKQIQSDVQKVQSMIDRGEKVYVSLAPSFVAGFPQYTQVSASFSCLKGMQREVTPTSSFNLSSHSWQPHHIARIKPGLLSAMSFISSRLWAS